uniref:Uncharacterized protein n=1 Tax=Rhizophora mucronata TaxID=61149 RepID=A0A2P2MQX5_RHIMU
MLQLLTNRRRLEINHKQ